jgi:hypothetical protein
MHLVNDFGCGIAGSSIFSAFIVDMIIDHQLSLKLAISKHKFVVLAFQQQVVGHIGM